MTGVERSIQAVEAPVTRRTLAADLRALGVREGGVLLVHASLSALGWVCGGAPAVALALLDALGPQGTLVVPTHTNDNSDPAEWSNPPVPEAWWETIRAEMPPHDPAVTPSVLGALTEVVRTWPGARRSGHPHYSFAALGPEAEAITAGHELESGMGEASPLARVYERDGDVLLLGVGHGANTSLHLAEYRVPAPQRAANGAAVRGPDGERRWVTWEDVLPVEDDFAALGADFDATGAVRVGRTGAAESRLMRQRELVDFGVGWLARDCDVEG